jgi:hypothetical protein
MRSMSVGQHVASPRPGQFLVAPIVEQAIMQPVPVHRGELVSQRLIQVLNNSLVILHALLDAP